MARPIKLSLDELRALPSRTQITRHDCVEGWSCIGKWKGVPLSEVLRQVEPNHPRDTRYSTVPIRCERRSEHKILREHRSDGGVHPQTILAYEMNDKVPVANGAPLRLRVERQLGYKMAKYVMRIELVESYANIGEGKGGYWEDHGYTWYAGI